MRTEWLDRTAVQCWAVTAAWLGCLALAGSAVGAVPASSSAPAPVTIELAGGGKARLPVVVGARASEAVKDSAGDLAKYLGLMSGAEFQVQVGDGVAGIVVGRVGDFDKPPVAGVTFGAGPFQREEYLLRSHAGGVWLLGASDLAVSHAVWDLLGRLGYRQFFPGEAWEVVPRADRLAIAVDERQAPAFYARRIWYDWGLWGYNDVPYRQWCVRNRTVRGFDLQSGHSYGGIIAANKAEFDKHPEYLALVGGKRAGGGDAKFCISNADLRKLVVDHAVRQIKRRPETDSISMDPSDGGGWCECPACAAMGSVSDRVVTLANEVAAAINDPSLEAGPKYVGMYAYNRHSAPPHIRVHPNVIPSATTAFIGGGLTFDQVVAGWQKQGATMGVYDYFSVVDWDWNLPRGATASLPGQVAEFLTRIHKQGVRFFDAESGDCWGPCGLGYYLAGRVLWDLGEARRVEAITEDFLAKAFGQAAGPMREFYRLINSDTQRRSPSDIVGRMYRRLDEARRATADPAVLRRLDDLTLYTRHAELYYAMANGGGSKEAVARHDYRMRKTMMVHSYGLWCRLISQKAALDRLHPWKSEEPFSPEELAAILAEGIAKNQPVEPGFVGVEYSHKLIPAAGRLKLAAAAPASAAAASAAPALPAGQFPPDAQDHQRYFIWVPPGAGAVDLKITVRKVWVNRMPRVALFSPLEVTLDPVASDESYKPDGREYDIRLKTPHAGLHRLETWDGGDYTRIAWPAGMAVTVESGMDTADVTSHFRGPWTLCFYVPKGTRLVGGWASRVANWAGRISGKCLDADGREVLDFAKAEDGFFKVPVASGQDGRCWYFARCVGQRLLMTVPPYLARTPAELLLPAEVVEADEGGR